MRKDKKKSTIKLSQKLYFWEKSQDSFVITQKKWNRWTNSLSEGDPITCILDLNQEVIFDGVTLSNVNIERLSREHQLSFKDCKFIDNCQIDGAKVIFQGKNQLLKQFAEESILTVNGTNLKFFGQLDTTPNCLGTIQLNASEIEIESIINDLNLYLQGTFAKISYHGLRHAKLVSVREKQCIWDSILFNPKTNCIPIVISGGVQINGDFPTSFLKRTITENLLLSNCDLSNVLKGNYEMISLDHCNGNLTLSDKSRINKFCLSDSSLCSFISSAYIKNMVMDQSKVSLASKFSCDSLTMRGQSRLTACDLGSKLSVVIGGEMDLSANSTIENVELDPRHAQLLAERASKPVISPEEQAIEMQKRREQYLELLDGYWRNDSTAKVKSIKNHPMG